MVAGGLIFFVQHGICNQLIQRYFLEDIGFDEMQKNLWRDRQAMMLYGDQHQQVGAYGSPDLCLHGVDRIAEEVLDRQILLQPLEEQFDLPAVLVDRGNCQCRDVEEIGEKDQMLAGLRIAKRHPAQPLGITGFRLWGCQQNRLIGAQTGSEVDLARGNPGRAQIVLGTNNETDLLPVQGKKTGEIQVATVDYENRSGWQTDRVEQAYVVNLAGRNADEHRDRAAQIHDHMSLDRSFGLSEVRPREQRETQIDGRRIHREDGPLQPKPDVLVAIQGQGKYDQALAKCFEQTIIPSLGGIGQRRAGNRAPDSDVIELRALGVHASHQIAQPGTAGQLCISQADEMAPCRERRHPLVGLVSIDQMLEVAEGNKLQQLCKDSPALIHDRASSASQSGDDTADRHSAISNRRNCRSAGKAHQVRLCAC